MSIKYPFLPNNIVNFKLSKAAVDVLKIRHFYGKCDDLISILASCGGTDAIILNDEIENSPIKESILYDIVKRNNLEELDIQKLNEQDVKLIMSSFINLDLFLQRFKNILEKDSYILRCADRDYLYTGDLNSEVTYSEGPESNKKYSLVAKNFLTGRKKNWDFKKQDRWNSKEYVYSVNNPEDFISLSAYSSFIISVPVPTISDEMQLFYEKDCKIYDLDIEEYKVIKNLHDKRVKEGIEDELPIEPVKPDESSILMYKAYPTYKGLHLFRFLEGLKEEPIYSEGSRIGLKEYFGYEVEAYGVLAEIQNDRRLFKNVVISGVEYDHIWIFNKIEGIKNLGGIYKIRGEVIQYKDKKGITKFGIKPEEVEGFR